MCHYIPDIILSILHVLTFFIPPMPHEVGILLATFIDEEIEGTGSLNHLLKQNRDRLIDTEGRR